MPTKCKWCDRQTGDGVEFCCSNCEIQWRVHEHFKSEGKILRCTCERCRSINHTINVIGGRRE
jgi:hypothetical protein